MPIPVRSVLTRAITLSAGVGLLAASTVVAAEPERLVGVLARSHGTLALAPCDGIARNAIDTTSGGSLAAAIDWLLDGHDGAIRVEVDASLEDGVWRLTHLRRAGRIEPGCPREGALGYVWKAVGEGGWRLLATPRSVQVTGVGGLEGRRFRFSPFLLGPNGNYRYEADAGGERFEIELWPGPCRSVDPNAQDAAVSDYRVELSWRARRWTGCAHNGFSVR